jgi:hypothetical protein
VAAARHAQAQIPMAGAEPAKMRWEVAPEPMLQVAPKGEVAVAEGARPVKPLAEAAAAAARAAKPLAVAAEGEELPPREPREDSRTGVEVVEPIPRAPREHSRMAAAGLPTVREAVAWAERHEGPQLGRCQNHPLASAARASRAESCCARAGDHRVQPPAPALCSWERAEAEACWAEAEAEAPRRTRIAWAQALEKKTSSIKDRRTRRDPIRPCHS